MRILADLHISPRTVSFLQQLGHDAIRMSDVLPATASDEAIVACAVAEARLILTQDLDFSGIIALSGQGRPSLLVLRLSSARIERVNTILARGLPQFEPELTAGAIITVEDQRVRRRSLPIP